MEELLPVTKYVLYFFGIQYTMMVQTLWKNMGRAKNKEVWHFKQKLYSIPVPTDAMNQIGVDICNLPEVDGSLVACMDYFNWSETTQSQWQFLYYELTCRHGCFSIQINDKGRVFVSSVSLELHYLNDTIQYVARVYHPQANDLVKRQKGTIRNSLIKALDSTLPIGLMLFKMYFLLIA